jgi:hypothetical protein
MGTPEYAQAAIDVHEQIKATMYVIGVIGQGPQGIVVKNNLENVFKTGDSQKFWWGAANWYWHTTHGEQWFFKS